ncbi:MAG: nitrate reductase [candidate division Zixibacteria bacterium HGW-Zixibacteria-1]|nr:MAG: nitrate reductase [candidate division Zixibacteria bacterium HGW-Zixibacteria-1]
MYWAQIITYVSVIVAFIAMAAKVLRYMTAPQSFRWELYPVPHEKGRAEYGGSYLEELDWWSKPRHADYFNEIKEMMEEILFLKGVYHNNKKVWISSLPFHLGLYLVIGWLLLLLLGGILEIAGVPFGADAGTFALVIHYLTIILGYAGLIMAGIGAIGLLIWRASNKAQRNYNAPADYFNLIIFIVVVGVTLTAQWGADPAFGVLRNYVGSLVTFSAVADLSLLMTVEIVLVSLLIMYIPLTRMSHFVAKYFLYHSVRWNDEPNERGSKIEKHIMELLNEKVGWNGAHVKTGKSWAEVVQESGNEQ